MLAGYRDPGVGGKRPGARFDRDPGSSLPAAGRGHLRPLIARDASSVSREGSTNRGDRAGNEDRGAPGNAHHRPGGGREEAGGRGGGRGPRSSTPAGKDFGRKARDTAGGPGDLDL